MNVYDHQSRPARVCDKNIVWRVDARCCEGDANNWPRGDAGKGLLHSQLSWRCVCVCVCVCVCAFLVTLKEYLIHHLGEALPVGNNRLRCMCELIFARRVLLTGDP